MQVMKSSEASLMSSLFCVCMSAVHAAAVDAAEGKCNAKACHTVMAGSMAG